MSAAEKLKALDAVWKTEGTEEAWQVYKTLMPALSQIVAVVEAAENVTFYGQEAHRYNEWHGSQIVLALSALDEALA